MRIFLSLKSELMKKNERTYDEEEVAAEEEVAEKNDEEEEDATAEEIAAAEEELAADSRGRGWSMMPWQRRKSRRSRPRKKSRRIAEEEVDHGGGGRLLEEVKEEEDSESDPANLKDWELPGPIPKDAESDWGCDQEDQQLQLLVKELQELEEQPGLQEGLEGQPELQEQPHEGQPGLQEGLEEPEDEEHIFEEQEEAEEAPPWRAGRPPRPPWGAESLVMVGRVARAWEHGPGISRWRKLVYDKGLGAWVAPRDIT